MSKEIYESGIVNFSIEDKIGILTISNGKQNKLDKADFLDLNYLKQWIDSSYLRGLIIYGEGRHFSSGANVDNLRVNKENIEYLRESLECGKKILSYIEALPIITVAAISGICFGGGLEIALSCQFRICTENAIFGFPEANIGIMPGLGGTIRLPKLVGKRKALNMIVSGKYIDAEEAFSIGLVDKIVDNKSHISYSKQFINELFEGKTTRQIKSIINSVNNSFVKTSEVALKSEGEMFLNLVKKL
ncbi:enoyl-CoA hydratase [Clostridium acetobutylicum]|uniref:Enoyl-CoA hydratase n=1 Tax=Clostridium acetobutylicum (strain ATCC 824 / DSM 792 / JCM 1419 / IAM 19013 / LMG 5710 / NBRC 13948 / NRRL B-527 / VKM B-1787 / 2291 / W) TaxID=272562 RepID=Q97HJ5_CLOAB|nr:MULTISPECIES: enoyl-CoA hydratase/isomerase family protein [Clostridium]AAK79975.1 Enoyl-CoA hydratase [Clostridium acetobutylicum ATCC 824]ADZ21068.1 Enoyl-CoA hydratase [Clostridium acetobutylicum EA 2018]AEI33740.1 enoyl-CoA hydratase [Clostridium acetobutylicum DSM 1731]AWV79594.1 enoyl-CoA hydratase/isomerase family protein [Clostridium acetobutylicum]MBC2394433.1 enoyl-CoA hydratase/isomerase family protein [Clostridium acetobutylicum]